MSTSMIRDVVRDFFNNAILIDDELKLPNKEIEQVNEIEIEGLPVIPGFGEQAAASKEQYVQEIPDSTFEQFLSDGFVTLPYPLHSKDYEQKAPQLSRVLQNVKIMVIDWDLADSKYDIGLIGDTAIKIIKQFTEQKKGLKSVVIYTKQEMDEVIPKLEINGFIVKRDGKFFEENKGEKESSLFGFIFKKINIPPNLIIEEISKILSKDKCITLHFMDCANKLEQNLSNTITKYNAPFEKAVYAQILTSQMPDCEIPTFLNDTLLTSILQEQSTGVNLNILFITKINKFKEIFVKGLTNKIIEDFSQAIRINKGNIFALLKESGFNNDVSQILEDVDINSFESLQKALLNYVKRVPGIKDAEETTKDFVLLILLLDNFVNDTQEFKQSFSAQLYYFTKLIKYIDNHEQEIKTGSIFKGKEAENTYYLCITPFCDVSRPEKVENSFKFITGSIIDSYNKGDLKNTKDNCFFMAVPFDDEKRVKFIKWNFYNTNTYNKDEVNKKLVKIATLKREYIQNVINRYISYHSRAGVEELFYKESEFIDKFSELLKIN